MAISVILLPRGSYLLEDIRCWLRSRGLSVIAFEQANCPDATSAKISDLFIQLAQSSATSQPVPIRGVSITFPATAPGNGFLFLVARSDFGGVSRPTVVQSFAQPDFGCFSRPIVGKLFAWPDFGCFPRPTVGQSFARPDFGRVFRPTVVQLFAWPDFGCISRPIVMQSFPWLDFGGFSRPTVGQSFAWPDFGFVFRPIGMQ